MARQSLALVSARAPSSTCAAPTCVASEIFDVRITPHALHAPVSSEDLKALKEAHQGSPILRDLKDPNALRLLAVVLVFLGCVVAGIAQIGFPALITLALSGTATMFLIILMLTRGKL